jgi:serine/threonine-protein kinase
VLEVEPLQSVLADRYRFERELGRGGMARVWLAQDLRHDRPVAFKVLRPDLAAAVGDDRFLREIRLTARLQHPNILPVLDSGAATDPRGVPLLWYTMPYVEGESLRARLARDRQLPTAEALAITREVADALDCAHEHGIVHRDVKPENILLGGHHALLADFGIAKLLAGDVSDAALTSTGLALGTPAYMSPEQALADPAVDARTDTYALGCVLYEMLAGEPPFTGPTPQAITARRLTDTAPSIRRVRAAVPDTVDAALERALARRPEDRFERTADFAAALETGAGERARKPRVGVARPRWTGPALAVAIVALAGLLVLRARRAAEVPAEAAVIPLAVLPFQSIGTAGDSGLLTIGLPDAIITRLANVRRLRVRPTSAILPYRSDPVDAQTAARQLGVSYVLAGTVQVVTQRLRVSVQLLRATDGAALWGARYDLDRQDLLTLQDSVAERVSGTLAVRLSAVDQERLYRRYTRNAAAFEWYLRGRAELARVSENGTRAAIAAFDHALAVDSTYALARAGLAMASADMHLRFATGPEVRAWGDRAEREAARAISLDPDLAEAHLARAAVARKADFDWDLTLAESERALDLNPSLDLAHYFRAAAFYHLGLLGRAAEEIGLAQQVDPQNRTERLRTSGVVAFLEGRTDEAIRHLEDVRRAGSKVYADSYLSQAYFYGGDTARAFGLLDSLAASSSGPAVARARSASASFAAATGDRARAERLIAQVVQGSYMDHHVAYSVGVAYAQMGRMAEATRWLERAASEGFPCYPWYLRDPLLSPFRASLASRDFLGRLRAQWEAAKARYV